MSFWPTWAGVWRDRARERSPAWGLWTFGDLATLLLAVRASHPGFAELAYVVVELLCHASVWFLIGLATINPLRSLGVRRGGLFLLDKYRPATNLFASTRPIWARRCSPPRRSRRATRCSSSPAGRFRADQVPNLMRGRGDRFVQVTPDHYMGPLWPDR
ncbi:MAG: hypothetical protein WDN44_16325 [Sphingomonas sp.]